MAILDHGRIIGVGTPAELVRRHCPERTVIVSTEDSTARSDFGQFRTSESVSGEGVHLTIRGRADDLVP